MAQLVDAQRKNDKALANYMGNAPETEGIKISPREWLGNLERRSSVFMILAALMLKGSDQSNHS